MSLQIDGGANVLKDTNLNEVLRIGVTGSAVNDITVTNAATGAAPSVGASGDDTNIDLALSAKGTGFLITAFGLKGNAAMLRVKRRAISYGSDANKTATSSEYDGTILDLSSSLSLTATRDLVLPLTDGAFVLVYNGTTGAQSVRVIGASGTGITIANAKAAWLFCDGTNWRRASADV